MVATFLAAQTDLRVENIMSRGNWKSSVFFQRHYDRSASSINWSKVIEVQTTLQKNSNSANSTTHQQKALESILESKQTLDTTTASHTSTASKQTSLTTSVTTSTASDELSRDSDMESEEVCSERRLTGLSLELQDCTLKDVTGLLEEEEFHSYKQKKKKKKVTISTQSSSSSENHNLVKSLKNSSPHIINPKTYSAKYIKEQKKRVHQHTVAKETLLRDPTEKPKKNSKQTKQALKQNNDFLKYYEETSNKKGKRYKKKNLSAKSGSNKQREPLQKRSCSQKKTSSGHTTSL